MLHIGLTGGIASGKSTVVTMLRELGQVSSTATSLPTTSSNPVQKDLRPSLRLLGRRRS